MESSLAQAIKLKNDPVAILWTDIRPEKALQFSKGQWGCVVEMLARAAEGHTAVFDRKAHGCPGGAVGLGFKRPEFGHIEYFLSRGSPGGGEGEYYKKTPECARESLESLPHLEVPTEYVVFKPLSELTSQDTPQAIVFLVNADQLSGLVTMANYDQPSRDNIIINFGAGCHSTLLEVIYQGHQEKPKAVMGLTDPSARKFISPELLSFSLPYKRFLELEKQVEESFLTKKTWSEIARRI
ncbi:MAG: hypothetical protein D5R97_10340 [Candidatus Syntrophonatronum acetioxidans]|uniref:DUF169 domain-containing protein n=1 Tax=Candidatus Syntrophonatronum acetioxidans TaxID=1795816 RepID=A0A424Y974_9FIRM|nr:MAG: hypothetical protein D5R97_10340 [Candidatus Syntrophonatronum acetioxidans]